ncbi:MAG: hypothetical protein FJ404_10910 [Verrucomicrobia bacterium]|nr:hypothetical protein [Verrucomicrobiota bacterium]
MSPSRWREGARLYTSSDDGSRLWVDLNADGKFEETGPEFLNNNWGQGQGTTRRGPMERIPAGTYAFRVQYAE